MPEQVSESTLAAQIQYGTTRVTTSQRLSVPPAAAAAAAAALAHRALVETDPSPLCNKLPPLDV